MGVNWLTNYSVRVAPKECVIAYPCTVSFKAEFTMFHLFSLASLGCIPSHNPDQRQKENAIMERPALKQLSKSWEETFPEAARLDEREKRMRGFRVIRSV